MTNRRFFLLGAAAVLATPAIVKESLMRIAAPKLITAPEAMELWTASYDQAFLKGLRQTMSQTVFYGNSFWLTDKGIMRHIPNDRILPSFAERLDETA